MIPAWTRRISAALVVASVCAGALVSRAVAGDGVVDPPKVLKTFPATACLQMRKAEDPIASLDGRVRLVILVDTRYERCAEAVPDMNALHDKLGPSGLTILGICADEEKADVDAWMKKLGVKWSIAIVNTAVKEQILQRDYPAPGFPWSYLLNAKGENVWVGHPQGLEEWRITPLLDASSVPPLLPASLAEPQKLLDDGTWAKARDALLAAADGELSKEDKGWAKGVAKWIETRRPRVLVEAEALEKEEWFWDAWWTWDDYTRRFEGMDGVDVARQRADAVRANAAAKQDLEWGDDLVKAKEFLAKGKKDSARLICERLSKLKSRFADRAKDLLQSMKKK